MSAPFGRRDHFFEAWQDGGRAWERYAVRGDQCPRIPATFLAEERRTLPGRWFAEEYGNRFEGTEDQLFASENIEAALTSSIKPLFASPVLLAGGAP